MNLEGLKRHIVDLLNTKLDPRLAYHNLEHTLDVYDAAVRLGEMENISREELQLLKATALLHDTGMLRAYTGHEEKSVEIASEILPEFNFGKQEIDTINQMIMSTMLPQNAANTLERIICDADLDYLGRHDFFMISLRLKYEWDVLDVNPTTLQEWYRIQVKFLSAHVYFTRSANALRQEQKEQHLQEIRAICSLEK